MPHISHKSFPKEKMKITTEYVFTKCCPSNMPNSSIEMAFAHSLAFAYTYQGRINKFMLTLVTIIAIINQTKYEVYEFLIKRNECISTFNNINKPILSSVIVIIKVNTKIRLIMIVIIDKTNNEVQEFLKY